MTKKLTKSKISAADSIASYMSVGYVTPFEYEELRKFGYIRKDGEGLTLRVVSSNVHTFCNNHKLFSKPKHLSCHFDL